MSGGLAFRYVLPVWIGKGCVKWSFECSGRRARVEASERLGWRV